MRALERVGLEHGNSLRRSVAGFERLILGWYSCAGPEARGGAKSTEDYATAHYLVALAEEAGASLRAGWP